jgi:hypothetical protein
MLTADLDSKGETSRRSHTLDERPGIRRRSGLEALHSPLPLLLGKAMLCSS